MKTIWDICGVAGKRKKTASGQDIAVNNDIFPVVVNTGEFGKYFRK
jgi:hypothetical protein